MEIKKVSLYDMKGEHGTRKLENLFFFFFLRQKGSGPRKGGGGNWEEEREGKL